MRSKNNRKLYFIKNKVKLKLFIIWNCEKWRQILMNFKKVCVTKTKVTFI
jgi:hypothetical protein